MFQRSIIRTAAYLCPRHYSSVNLIGDCGAVEKVPCIPYNTILHERRNNIKHGG